MVLDTTVTDKEGHTVPNLGKDNFTVFEDGQPQSLRSVEYTGGTSSPSSKKDALHVIYILDELNTPFDDANAARQAFARYLAQQPATLPAQSMLLAVNDLGFQRLVDYTTDRAAVQAGLRGHKARLPLAAMQGDTSKQLSISLEVLRQLARSGGGVPGRKLLLWVGRGMPGIDLNSVSADSAIAARSIFTSTTNLLLENRVVLYRIDPAAAGYTFSPPLDQGLDEAFDTSPEPYAISFSFSMFAKQTGGKNFFGTNDISGEIQQAVDTASSYYTLTYVPVIKQDGPNDYRHIRVTVHRPNLVATTREGYYSGANQAPEQGRAGADAAADDASRNHLSYAALEVHILSVSTSTAGAPSKCIVSVKTGDLAWQYSNDGARSVQLVLAAETFDGKHAQASYAKSPVTLSQSAAEIAKGADVVTSFSVPVRIPAQAASLRLVLVDESSGQVGSDETPLLHSTPQP